MSYVYTMDEYIEELDEYDELTIIGYTDKMTLYKQDYEDRADRRAMNEFYETNRDGQEWQEFDACNLYAYCYESLRSRLQQDKALVNKLAPKLIQIAQELDDDILCLIPELAFKNHLSQSLAQKEHKNMVKI